MIAQVICMVMGTLISDGNLKEEDGDPEEDAYFWRSEVEIHGEEGKVTEADYKALAQVLATFKVVKGASLFTRKGDALNRTLAAIPILTT